MFIDNNKSIFEQIVDHIEATILSGDIKESEFIPSVREFAVKNSVNPNTVAKAYQELQRRELVQSIRGRGLQVSELKDSFLEKRKNQILLKQIDELKKTAKQLGLSTTELKDLIKEKL